jgi:hypothetical protein
MTAVVEGAELNKETGNGRVKPKLTSSLLSEDVILVKPLAVLAQAYGKLDSDAVSVL